VLYRFRPDVLLTYDGHPICLELMRRTGSPSIAVVFHLHNFAYGDSRAFAHVAALIFPSEHSRRCYAERIGLDSTVIADPVQLDRVIAENPESRYLTFVNPQAEKGVIVFARIALKLGRRRPDIPLLLVEGRWASDALDRLPPDISGLTNLYRMASTPDPRDFYRVSRAVLMPSLWRELLGQVAMEAMANGIPVLASDRAALHETLGDAGFVFTIPERCTPANGAVPTAREAAPWVASFERLWDDPAFEARHRALAMEKAQFWQSDRLTEHYQTLFATRGTTRHECSELGRSRPAKVASSASSCSGARSPHSPISPRSLVNCPWLSAPCRVAEPKNSPARAKPLPSRAGLHLAPGRFK
jgi:glycosyltransferase involved in cell wall biosynthesis